MIESAGLRQATSEVTRAWGLVHGLPLDGRGPGFWHFHV